MHQKRLPDTAGFWCIDLTLFHEKASTGGSKTNTLSTSVISPVLAENGFT